MACLAAAEAHPTDLALARDLCAGDAHAVATGNGPLVQLLLHGGPGGYGVALGGRLEGAEGNGADGGNGGSDGGGVQHYGSCDGGGRGRQGRWRGNRYATDGGQAEASFDAAQSLIDASEGGEQGFFELVGLVCVEGIRHGWVGLDSRSSRGARARQVRRCCRIGG